MNEIILGLIGLIVVVAGAYIYRAEKERRKKDEGSQQPWDSRNTKKPRR